MCRAGLFTAARTAPTHLTVPRLWWERRLSCVVLQAAAPEVQCQGGDRALEEEYFSLTSSCRGNVLLRAVCSPTTAQCACPSTWRATRTRRSRSLGASLTWTRGRPRSEPRRYYRHPPFSMLQTPTTRYSRGTWACRPSPTQGTPGSAPTCYPSIPSPGTRSVVCPPPTRAPLPAGICRRRCRLSLAFPRRASPRVCPRHQHITSHILSHTRIRYMSLSWVRSLAAMSGVQTTACRDGESLAFNL